MLSRNKNGFDVFSIHGNLGFAVGKQPFDLFTFSKIFQATSQFVNHGNRSWQIFGGFIRCKAVHNSLIARSSGIYPHGDIGRLFDYIGDDFKFIGVPDFFVNFSGNLGSIKLSMGSYFSTDYKKSMGAERFDCDTAFGILPETFIKNCIRNLIANFIGVSFGYGLDCISFEVISKNVTHIVFSFSTF